MTMKLLRIWTATAACLCVATLAAGAILSPWIWLVTAGPLGLILLALVWMWQQAETPAETRLLETLRRPYQGSALSTMYRAQPNATSDPLSESSAPTTGTTPRLSGSSGASREQGPVA